MANEASRLSLFVSDLAGGGAQRRMLVLADAFAGRDRAVDLVAARSIGPFMDRIPPSVRFVALDPWPARLPMVASRMSLWVMASIPALANYLRREKPGALLATTTAPNIAALWARRRAGAATRVVISTNVPLTLAAANPGGAWRPFLAGLARRWYPEADELIANSGDGADTLARDIGVARERVATIHNPVETGPLAEKAAAPLDHPWFAPGQPPVVLGVGKLKAQKDFETLVRAFARVRANRPARLVILGEGAGRRRLQSLAAALGVAPDMALPGFAGNPFAYMARASVFVVSSAWEGFSNALTEAMACGCPVVATDCPGASADILEGGVHGPLVAVGDGVAMATAILAMLDKPPARDSLRARAAVFSVDAAARRYLAVLDGAAGAAAAPESGRA